MKLYILIHVNQICIDKGRHDTYSPNLDYCPFYASTDGLGFEGHGEQCVHCVWSGDRTLVSSEKLDQ